MAITKLERDKRNGHSRYWKLRADEAFMLAYRGKPCAVCGVTQNTVGHHLVPKGRCPVHRYTPVNILPLCPLHHTFSPEMAPHSMNPLAVRRFLIWLKERHPMRYDWMVAHERDTGRVDFRAVVERITAQRSAPCISPSPVSEALSA